MSTIDEWVHKILNILRMSRIKTATNIKSMNCHIFRAY